MLRQALQVNGTSVYVYNKKCMLDFGVALDFEFEDLFFVLLEDELWAVGCYDDWGHFLIFDGLELISNGQKRSSC